jgi:transcriptional regulator with XRE-family HTH domain
MSSNLRSSATEMSSGKGSGRLTPERIKQLAECLIAGCTRAETAEALGVSPRTVSRWKKDPVVVAEVDRLRSRTNETRVEDVLLRLLKSDDERIVLGAAREIYRWKIQRAPVEPEPEPEREVEEGYILVRREPFR